MATIGSDSGGLRRILFVAADGKRKTIRLGKVSLRQAEAFKVKVEELASAAMLGHPPSDDLTRWLNARSDTLYGRLAAVKLVPDRGASILATWIDSYITERTDLKRRTLDCFRATKFHLVSFFGETRPMRSITRDETSKWRAKLLADGLAVATVRLYVGTARTLFNKAVERDLIPKNPFDHIPGGTTASKNDRYVTAEDAEKVIEACTDTRAKLLVALPRYAGLRVPSEIEPLTWADIDWKKCSLNVRSPKTEHHKGHDRRTVPILPKLMSILETAYHAAPEGETNIVRHRSNQYNRDALAAAIKRAEVETWDDPFRTLRSSCEREWAMTLPQYAVSKWMGHSITVSGKHYANHVPDEVFEKAAQKAAQQPLADVRTPSQVPSSTNEEDAGNLVLCGDMRDDANPYEISTRTVKIDPSSRHS